jgi:hypothetical protein
VRRDKKGRRTTFNLQTRHHLQYIIAMFNTIVLASLPLLAQAAYLDPSLQQHPLLDIKPIEQNPDRVVSLTVR